LSLAPFKNSENKEVCTVRSLQRKRANIKIAWAAMIEIKFSMWVVAQNRNAHSRLLPGACRGRQNVGHKSEFVRTMLMARRMSRFVSHEAAFAVSSAEIKVP
jgi:hypothetical protein